MPCRPATARASSSLRAPLRALTALCCPSYDVRHAPARAAAQSRHPVPLVLSLRSARLRRGGPVPRRAGRGARRCSTRSRPTPRSTGWSASWAKWRAREAHPAVRFALASFRRRPDLAKVRAVSGAVGLSPSGPSSASGPRSASPPRATGPGVRIPEPRHFSTIRRRLGSGTMHPWPIPWTPTAPSPRISSCPMPTPRFASSPLPSAPLRNRSIAAPTAR